MEPSQAAANQFDRSSESRTIWFALAVLTALVLAVRLTGLGHGLPHAPEPDAYLVDQARVHQSGVIRTTVESENYGKYPHLLSRLFALLPDADQAPETLGGELEAASRPYWFGRLVVALISTLLVPLTFLLARRFLPPGWALAAAAFAGTSFLHQTLATQARPHGPLATFTTLGLLSLFALVRKPNAGAYLRAGLACGLAVACLHNGFAIAFPALLAHWLVSRGGGWRAQARALLPLIPILALILVCYPFLFPALREHLPFVAHDQTGQLPFFPHAAGGHWTDWVHGQGFGLMIGYLWSFDPALLVLMVGGLLVGARHLRATLTDEQRGRELLIAGSFVLPYVLVLGAFDRTYERFLTPLIPFAACFAASGLRAASNSFGPGRARALGFGLAAAGLAFPITVSVRAATLRTQPDPSTEVAEWVFENLDPDQDRIVVSPLASFPLPFTLEGDPESKVIDNHLELPWPGYQVRSQRANREAYTIVPMAILPADQPPAIKMRESRARLRRQLMDSECEWVILRVRPDRAMYEVFAAVLGVIGTRVERFTARIDGTVPVDRGHERALQVFSAERRGPSHDIYRITALVESR